MSFRLVVLADAEPRLMASSVEFCEQSSQGMNFTSLHVKAELVS